MHERALLGRSGEDLAAAIYERQGFDVQRNFRCKEGEIDLVAVGGGLVVFCEVKTRTTEYFGLPAEAVGHRKRAKIRAVASQWLAENRPGRVELRFDVVSVIVGPRGPRVTHIPNAF